MLIRTSSTRKRVRRLSFENLERRDLLATITRVLSPDWSFQPGTYPAGYNLNWQAGENSNELSFFGATFDFRYFGLPQHTIPGWFRVREGASLFHVTPTGSDKIGDEIEVTLIASIQAHSDHTQLPPYVDDYFLHGPHDKKRIDAVVSGPGGVLLDFHQSRGFGSQFDARSQIIKVRVGDDIPIAFDFSGDGYLYNVTEGTLSIRAVIDELPDISAPGNGKAIQWNSLEDGGGFTFDYSVSSSKPDQLETAVIGFYWAKGETEKDVVPVHRAYEVKLSHQNRDRSIEIEAGGLDLLSPGLHRIRIPHKALYEEGGVIFPDIAVTHLIMELDTENDIEEALENNNRYITRAFPISVNVVTHGWKPPLGPSEK